MNSFKFPVFFKFHNFGGQKRTAPIYQYNLWVSIFKDADITIICEDGTLTSHDCTHPIIPKVSYWDDSQLWQQEIVDTLSPFWRPHAEANLTPTTLTDAEYYWIIDADDLHFQVNDKKDLEKLTNSLKSVEEIVLQEGLLFSAYDINYSNRPMPSVNFDDPTWGHACLGVCLLKNDNFYNVDKLSIKEESYGINHDVILEVLHHTCNKSKIFTVTDILFEQYDSRFGGGIQHKLYPGRFTMDYQQYQHHSKSGTCKQRSEIVF